MRKITLSLVTCTCILLLTACNLPSAPGVAPTGDVVATRVIQMLTSAPTMTAPAAANPTAAPPATLVPATATTAPTATITTAPSATVGPTATMPSGDPKSSLGTPAWHDTLDSGKAFYQYDNGNTRVAMEGGALVLSGANANGWLGWSLTYSHPAKNFYLEAIFNPQTCSGADAYGIVFRAPNTDSGYFFSVTCDGKYNLHARDFAANTDNALVDLTSNSAIQPGSNQTNRLGVMANGEKIALYANGVLLHELTDSTYTGEGDFGALIAANATAGFTAKMTEISLWKLP